MGKLLVAIAVGVVFVILCLGLWTLFRGGDISLKWSNKLDRPSTWCPPKTGNNR